GRGQLPAAIRASPFLIAEPSSELHGSCGRLERGARAKPTHHDALRSGSPPPAPKRGNARHIAAESTPPRLIPRAARGRIHESTRASRTARPYGGEDSSRPVTADRPARPPPPLPRPGECPRPRRSRGERRASAHRPREGRGSIRSLLATSAAGAQHRGHLSRGRAAERGGWGSCADS